MNQLSAFSHFWRWIVISLNYSTKGAISNEMPNHATFKRRFDLTLASFPCLNSYIYCAYRDMKLEALARLTPSANRYQASNCKANSKHLCKLVRK